MTDEERHNELMGALRDLWKKVAEVQAAVKELQATGQQGLQFKEKKPDPNHALLKGVLLTAWLKTKGNNYRFEARDARAVTNLLKRKLEPDAMKRQWQRAMAAGESSIFMFDLNFNRYNESASGTRPNASGADLYAEKK